MKLNRGCPYGQPLISVHMTVKWFMGNIMIVYILRWRMVRRELVSLDIDIITTFKYFTSLPHHHPC
jgi:hypothetical protein